MGIPEVAYYGLVGGQDSSEECCWSGLTVVGPEFEVNCWDGPALGPPDTQASVGSQAGDTLAVRRGH